MYIMSERESKTIESSTVKNITSNDETAILSVNIGLLFLLCICLLQSGKVFANEVCPAENCISPNQCEELMKGEPRTCSKEGTKCCSVVKDEFRTHCRHHGGTCMNSCGSILQRQSIDCNGSQVCCVLV